MSDASDSCWPDDGERLIDDEFAAWLEKWPNCGVPDCAYKVCTWLSADRCYNHALGRTPPDPGEYFKDWKRDDN